MDLKGKRTTGKKPGPRNHHEWNDSISDMSGMRLSKQEQTKKMVARQSHNLALAKAEMIERNRQTGSPRSFSPALSARLRASGSKTVEEALADGSAAIALAHKVRTEDMNEQLNKVETYFMNQIHAKEILEGQKHYSAEESDDANLADAEEIIEKQQHRQLQQQQQLQQQLQQQQQQHQQIQQQHQQQQQQQQQQQHLQQQLQQQHQHLHLQLQQHGGHDEDKRHEMSVVQRGSLMAQGKEGVNPYPLSPQGWQNLNNTIQLVVKTCEALWQQLEEERVTRQRLHFQLQEQRSVITTLTAELLQIQEHQELILKELHSARSTYPPSQAPRDLLQHQQQQQQQQQQPQQQATRSQIPFKGFSDPLSRGERLPPPRSYAFSDSSIETRQQQQQPRSKGSVLDGMDLRSHAQLPPNQMFRLSHQGKSKSVSQLNREREIQDSIHESLQYNASGMSFLNDASVLDLLRNYHITDG